VADPIEITQLMLDAGRDVLEKFYIGDGRYLLSDENLAEILRAVLKAEDAATQPQQRVQRRG